MLKLKNIEKEKFDEFVKNHKTKSHFLQSLSWGEFAKVKKHLTPYYLGLVNENDEIIAATLLLEKSLPMNMCYFYAPRGFVVDYKKKELVREMTKKVIEFAKNKKAIFVKIDPDIIKESTNYLGETKENPDYENIFNTLKECGFKHQGFTKNFETMQPRYTFRIDLTQSEEEIYNHFSKTTKQRIQKAIKLGTKVKIGNTSDIETFYHLMLLTEDRKDFVSYSKDYYETLYKLFEKNNMVKLFLGYIEFDEVISNLENELNDVNKKIEEIDPTSSSKNTKNKLRSYQQAKEKFDEEIKKYKSFKKEYGNTLTLNAHMIIIYQDKAWVLYAGNHNVLTESYANYRTYYEHIKFAKENGINIYDQFGTIGDLRKENKRLGLHEFKKKFGGNYVEFIGEFDYVTNHIMYFVFTKLVPLYRKIVRLRSKKEVNHEVNSSK